MSITGPVHNRPNARERESTLQLKAFLILAQTISDSSQTARVPDPSNQTARDNISSRSDQFQLAIHLLGGPFNPT
ncbi:hypothetical protein F2Q69_00037841 [Brassica cretica]|uniref:Uncharacterized protein n=1 Tax=Brassica cretica TaxID=69181 RepID=A0A8S9SER6_BRACR|nr:hypothetical protein F2Q69_00037841 [Brassica cretica]